MSWLLALAFGGAILLALWLGPKLQVFRLTADPVVRFDKENEARKTLATVIGGFAIVISLYSTTMTLDATREGQITERYTKAVEQLGALKGDRQPNIEVRLGGIYALARIAKDSDRDRETIEQVLTAYMRQNAPTAVDRDCPDTVSPRADLQAIMWTLGDERYRGPNARKAPFNLRAVNLCGFSLTSGKFDASFFTMADLRRADVRGAGFRGAWLEYVDFRAANLQTTNFDGAKLRGALFNEADLRGATLTRALLTDAKFRAARLDGSNFAGANVESADFQGADLGPVQGLCVEQLAMAKTDGRTRPPKDLPRCGHGK